MFTFQDPDYLKGWHPSVDTIDAARERSRTVPNDEAVGGWCEVDCGSVLSKFMIVMMVLSILFSTGRVGNALVALRCIDVRDKSLSLAFNIAFLSLLGKCVLKNCLVQHTHVSVAPLGIQIDEFLNAI